MRTPKSLLTLAAALLTAALSFMACDREEAVVQQADTYRLNFTPARTNGELKALTLNPKVNMVRSMAQLDELIAKNKTPLSRLSPEVIADFKDGLVFRNGGVAGVRFDAIKKLLTEDEYNGVMAMLGLDTEKGFWGGATTNPGARTNTGEQDYKNYECFSANTCRGNSCCICTTNC